MKLQPLLLTFASLSLLQANPVQTTFDYSTWLGFMEQVPNSAVLSENFAGNQINTPGLTLRSVSGPNQAYAGNGYFANNRWNDDNGNSTSQGSSYDVSILSYANGPLYGIFGTDWNVSAGNGLSIYGTQADGYQQDIIVGSPHAVPGYPEFSGNWGFFTSTPFTTITFASDVGEEIWSVGGFALGDPSPTATPEPGMMFGVGFSLLALGAFFRKKGVSRA